MTESGFDITRKFVRVMRTRANGLVEFEFAVGDSHVVAELIMPQAAFETFCRDNQVEEFSNEKPSLIDAEATDADFNWNLHQATHQRFR